MTKTLTVEADVNSANTRTNLTAQGSVSAPSRVTPNNARMIDQVIGASSADEAAEGAASILVRLGGPAVQNGEQQIFIGGLAGNTIQAGSDTGEVFSPLFNLKNAQIPCSASEVVDIDAEVCGDDLGDVSVVVSLIFE